MTSVGTLLSEVTVCTPWYPTGYNPVGGSFVADWSSLSARLTGRLRVVHAEEWPGGTPQNVAKWSADTDQVLGSLAGRGALDVQGRWGRITRVPTVITSGWDVAERAEAAVDSVRRYGGPFVGPVVHGHVGYLGGLIAARLADPATRVVVTEHSTGLADFLADARGRDLYAEVLERAHRLTCVSSVVQRLITEHFPEHAEKVVVVPNPVDFHPQHQRSSPPQVLDRWVFGGGLIARKGVVRLVKAFISFARDRPAATLDVFGQGELQPQLTDLLAVAGLASRVTWHGNVGHGDFLQALPRYDVLLAPSHYETFHLVVPEALAAGVPVVVTRSGGPEEALAGVEDRVGRFIDVNDDPDELIGAVLDLEEGLGRLDLEGARSVLDGRYGPSAVTGRLAELYGVTPTGAEGLPSPSQTSRAAGATGVTFLSALGWRKYAIESEAAAARQVGLPLEVVTADAGVQQAVPDAVVTAPQDFLADLGSPPRRPARGLLDRIRGARSSAPAPAHPRGDDTTYVLTHPSSSAWAAALLRARPDADVVVELDRGRVGLPPVDAP